jgi:hypothetical protein
MIRDTSRLPTRKEIQAQMDLLATSIDFKALIKVGVLEKKGACYIVKDMGALPEHVTAQISAIKAGQGRVVMINFRRSVKSA